MTMLLPLLAFVFGSLLVTAVTYALTTRSAGLNARLRDVVGGGAQAEAAIPDQSNEQVVAFFKRIGEKAPQSPKELGKLRLRLIQAGYRGGEALFVFLGIRVACALCAFAFFMTPLVGRPNLLSALPAMAMGYVIPGMILARKAKKRQQ